MPAAQTPASIQQSFLSGTRSWSTGSNQSSYTVANPHGSHAAYNEATGNTGPYQPRKEANHKAVCHTWRPRTNASVRRQCCRALHVLDDGMARSDDTLRHRTNANNYSD
eukprot:4782991-Amphidinium_carterae.1